MKNWLASMAEVSSTTLKKVIGKNVGEITTRQGLFTNEITRSLLPEISTLHRADFPMNDIDLMRFLFSRDAYYYIGTPYKQIFPTSSLDTIWAFQVLNYPSVQIPSSGHFFTTLAKEQSIQDQKERDLRESIEFRLKELRDGGYLIFDILGTPKQEIGLRVWDCLDIALRMSVENNIIQRNQFSQMNLHIQFRDLEEVTNIIRSLPCKLIELKNDEIYMESYSKYLDNKNLDAYVDDLAEFWKYEIWMLLISVLKDKMRDVEIKNCTKEILKRFKQVCIDVKPIAKQNLFTFLIQK